MPHRYEDDWNELARREPYFAVLTDRQFLGANLDDGARRAFFGSGEEDVERLFGAIGNDFRPRAALDFGCGVGRLTRALASRVDEAVGCDISPEMIEVARENVPNATFVTSLEQVSDRRFDLILSLIVFQHIPPEEGLRTLTALLRLLAPGGVAALHFTLRRPGGALRRAARTLRASLPWLHRLAQRWEGDELRLPYMQMNEYDAAEVRRRITAETGSEPRIIPRREGDIEGALFLTTPRSADRPGAPSPHPPRSRTSSRTPADSTAGR